MKRREFAASCFAAATPSLLWSQPAAPSDPKATVIDWPPIQLLDGTTLTPQQWQGRSAMVVFWETTCPFCKRHNAHLDKLFRSSTAQKIRILSVALDTEASTVRSYMAANNFSFPVSLNGGVLRQRLTQRRVIPMTCTLDKQGRLLQAIPGEMFEEDVMELGLALAR